MSEIAALSDIFTRSAGRSDGQRRTHAEGLI